MNDFTKEELQAIYCCVNPIRISPDMCGILKWKIQDMIINYCEHNFIGQAEGKYKFPYCNKCQQVIPIEENIESNLEKIEQVNLK